MRNGRPPTNDDKAPMSERYIAYKMVRFDLTSPSSAAHCLVIMVDLRTGARGEGLGDSQRRQAQRVEGEGGFELNLSSAV